MVTTSLRISSDDRAAGILGPGYARQKSSRSCSRQQSVPSPEPALLALRLIIPSTAVLPRTDRSSSAPATRTSSNGLLTHVRLPSAIERDRGLRPPLRNCLGRTRSALHMPADGGQRACRNSGPEPADKTDQCQPTSPSACFPGHYRDNIHALRTALNPPLQFDTVVHLRCRGRLWNFLVCSIRRWRSPLCNSLVVSSFALIIVPSLPC